MSSRILINVLLVLCLAGCGSGDVVIKGSDTVLPLSQREAEEFMKEPNATAVTVIGGGSGVGIAGIMDGTCQIAQSFRSCRSYFNHIASGHWLLAAGCWQLLTTSSQ